MRLAASTLQRRGALPSGPPSSSRPGGSRGFPARNPARRGDSLRFRPSKKPSDGGGGASQSSGDALLPAKAPVVEPAVGNVLEPASVALPGISPDAPAVRACSLSVAVPKEHIPDVQPPRAVENTPFLGTIFPTRTSRFGRWVRRNVPGPLSVLMGWGAVTGSCLLSLTAHHFVPPGTVQHWALSLSGLLFVAVVLPLLDVATGAEATSQPVFPSRPGEAALFQAVQLLVLPAHLAVVAAWVHAAATVPFNPLLWAAWFASTAAHGGVAFTAAHEGVHRGGWQGIAARILLASCCYGHWEQGHLAHHAAAGTERDAATARLNEPLLPDFLVRNVKGAWADGVAAGGRAGMARWAGASVAFGWAAALAAGPMGLAGFLACAASCITMLNFADYIEHYGLQFPEHARRRDPVSVTWDADWIASNCATFFLQRHSHHHRQPSRAYYALRSFRDRADAPKMPMSYPAMFLLAAVPPLWFRVMNPRVRQHQERVVKEMIDDINQAIDDNGLEAAAALRSN